MYDIEIKVEYCKGEYFQTTLKIERKTRTFLIADTKEAIILCAIKFIVS